MEVFKSRTHFDFVSFRRVAMVVSGLMILASAVSLGVQGLNFGIDFAGGTLVQIKFPTAAPVQEMRSALKGLELGEVVIQEFGDPSEVLVRVGNPGSEDQRLKPAELAQKVVEAVTPLAGAGGVEMRRVEFVGPQVGEELTIQGLLAVLYSCIAILIYVAWRFEFRFAAGAVLALVHDSFITVGFFSLTQREFTLVVVAAILTVIGYSINDTIVVFDRIREEMRRLKRAPLDQVINEAVNGTLSRTIITSWTVILVLLALVLVGGEVIRDFSLALLFGILVGTYSSIYVAAPVVLSFDRGQPSPLAEREQAAGS